MSGRERNRKNLKNALQTVTTLFLGSILLALALWKMQIITAKAACFAVALVFANLTAVSLFLEIKERAAKENKKGKDSPFPIQEAIIEVDENLTIKNIYDPLNYCITCYDREELIGKPLEMLYAKPEEIKAVFKNINKPEVMDEVEIKRKDGSPIICRQIIAPAERGKGFVISLLNITEHVNALRNLRKSNEDLKRINEEKELLYRKIIDEERFRILGVMASGVAHTFNNILSIILGSTELIEATGPQEGIKKWLDRIKRASLEGAKVVVRLQELAVKDYERGMEQVDLSHQIKTILEGLKPLFLHMEKEVGSRLEVESKVEPSLIVRGNTKELKEAFMSLISSSFGMLGKKGKMVVDAFRSGDKVNIVLSLEGTILEEEDREKLFNPFADMKVRKRFDFGMNIAKWTLERHGGSISVEPVKRGKVSIKVTLPAVRKAEEKAGVKGPEGGTPEARARKGLHVLVVDDEQDIAEILAEQITNLGGRVETSFDGEEALEKFKKHESSGDPFDIVLADISMPKMDGWELAKKLQEEFSFTNVVLVTGWGLEVPESKVKEYKIKRVVSKPFTIEDIKSILSDLGE